MKKLALAPGIYGPAANLEPIMAPMTEEAEQKIWGSHGKSNDDDGKYRLCSSKSWKDKQNEEVVQ